MLLLNVSHPGIPAPSCNCCSLIVLVTSFCGVNPFSLGAGKASSQIKILLLKGCGQRGYPKTSNILYSKAPAQPNGPGPKPWAVLARCSCPRGQPHVDTGLRLQASDSSTSFCGHSSDFRTSRSEGWPGFSFDSCPHTEGGDFPVHRSDHGLSSFELAALKGETALGIAD